MRVMLVALLSLMMQQDLQRPGVIEGVINRVGTDFPIAGALVKVGSAPSLGSRPTPFAETVTDGSGRFVFNELPPGAYVIEVSMEGYVFGMPPGLSPTFTSRLTIGPGQRVPLLVQGAQAATIRGRVVDSEDRGLPEIVVEIVQSARNARGEQVWRGIVGGEFPTDDKGAYEKAMLAPGQYYVRASISRPDTPKTWVYYPETTNPNAAKPVELHEGSAATADIKVGPSIDTDTYRISGTVRSPVESAPAVALILRERPDPSSNRLSAAEGNPRTYSDSQPKTGKFEFRSIRSGTYELYATAEIDGKEYLAKNIVEVRGRDVEDLELVLRAGLSLQGRLVIDGEPRDMQLVRRFPPADDSRDPNRSYAGDVKVLLNRQDGLFGESVFQPVIDESGKAFTFQDVPEGDYAISASFVPDEGRSVNTDLYVADIRVTGRSVFDNGFQVGVDPVDAIEVIVGTQGGSIKGTVQGRPANTSALVLLLPSPFPNSSGPYRHTPVILNDRDDFEMRGVRPGTYIVFAVPGPGGTGLAQGGAPMVLNLTPEVFSLYESRAARISVEKGNTTGGVRVPYVLLGK